jgi:hypothetical protein
MRKLLNKPSYTYKYLYVLSFARKIMNELIINIGVENIWYRDTNNIFVKKYVFDNNNIKLNLELCELINDFGEKSCITYKFSYLWNWILLYLYYIFNDDTNSLLKIFFVF